MGKQEGRPASAHFTLPIGLWPPGPSSLPEAELCELWVYFICCWPWQMKTIVRLTWDVLGSDDLIWRGVHSCLQAERKPFKTEMPMGIQRSHSQDFVLWVNGKLLDMQIHPLWALSRYVSMGRYVRVLCVVCAWARVHMHAETVGGPWVSSCPVSSYLTILFEVGLLLRWQLSRLWLGWQDSKPQKSSVADPCF